MTSTATIWLTAMAVPSVLSGWQAIAEPATEAGTRALRASRVVGNAALAGYDGSSPGPILRLRRGNDLQLRFVNGLDEPTDLLWHGLRRANTLAPPPRRPTIAPGESIDVRFSCPDAGTFWYHAVDAMQRRRGLYGLVVIEESEPVAVDRELPLIVGEPWTWADAATSNALPRLVANGAPAVTTMMRPNERLRLRLVNAASTVIAVRLDRLRPVVMALDGQPCEPFAARDGRVFLGAGNRADLFVDMTLAPNAAQAIVAETDAHEIIIAILACSGAPVRSTPLAEPTPLPANPLPARMDFAGALKLDIDLAATPPELSPRPAFTARRGRTVMLGLANRTADLKTVRVDGHAFRLLDRLDDGWKPFWLDTVVVPPGRTSRIAFVTEEPGAWLIEATGQDGQPGLTTWFEIS